MSILDRYVVRQVLLPFLLGLLIFTFIFIIPPLLDYAEDLVAKGVAGSLVAGLIALLLPQALAITIPMSLLLALLIAFGRLSADREFVAMQACGISLRRLLWPVAMISVSAWALTSYVLIQLVPGSNQRFLDTVFDVASQRAEGDVKPRTFFTDFPNLVVYVQEISASGHGWNGVLLADLRPDQHAPLYLAERGRVVIDRQHQRIDLELINATRYRFDDNGKDESLVIQMPRAAFSVDSASMFARVTAKNIRQMSIAELHSEIARRGQELDPATNQPFSTHNERMEIHKRFSIPVACLVFGLIGLALGATNRRDGAFGSFVIGIAVVFAYYVPLMIGPSLVKGHYLPPWLGSWLPNFALGALGILMFVWRDRLADQPFRLKRPQWLAGPLTARHVRIPGLTILDDYITRTYCKYALLSLAALIGIFYIAAFVDVSDKLFKGMATPLMIVDFFRYSTPEWLYYAVPLAVLLSALITIAMLTKNSELIVMKACGISLYRVAAPMFVVALVVGGGIFALQETILGPSTRRADELKAIIKGNPLNLDLLNNRWLVGGDGRFYHYLSMDPTNHVLTGLDVYEFTPRMTRLVRRTYADVASLDGGATDRTWQIHRGWDREFDEQGNIRPTSLVAVRRTLESADYFGTQEPNARFMGYSELLKYTDKLRAGGFAILEQQVALARKLAFPFVTLIMTLLAVPFASTIGRSGAMGGVGVGIALAISYWTLISVFAALGTGGALPPMLAAWAPNLLFGAAALYLLLTVRT